MIVTLDVGSRPMVGTIMVEAWKHGIEIEHLHDYQVELTSGDDIRMNNLISKFPSAKILHTELVKEI